MQRMDCSMVDAILLPDSCLVAHAGDTRAYLLLETGLYQMTVDDTPVGPMVKRGYLLPEKARIHNLKNLLTKSIGTQAEVNANIIKFPVKHSERLLFCSDGLWGQVKDDLIAQVISR